MDTTQYICPCGLDEEEEETVKAVAFKAFNSLGASGWGRVDLFINNEGEIQLIEVNTVPGMTSHSLVPMAAKQIGLEFDDLVIRILDTSMESGMEAETATA